MAKTKKRASKPTKRERPPTALEKQPVNDYRFKESDEKDARARQFVVRNNDGEYLIDTCAGGAFGPYCHALRFESLEEATEKLRAADIDPDTVVIHRFSGPFEMPGLNGHGKR